MPLSQNLSSKPGIANSVVPLINSPNAIIANKIFMLRTLLKRNRRLHI